MEFEKTLFRIHERMMASPKTPMFLKPIWVASAFLSAIFLLFVLTGEFIYSGQPGKFGTEYVHWINQCNNKTNISKDFIHYFIICDYNTQSYHQSQNDRQSKAKVDVCGRPIDEPDGENQNQQEDQDQDKNNNLRNLNFAHTEYERFYRRGLEEETTEKQNQCDGESDGECDGEGNKQPNKHVSYSPRSQCIGEPDLEIEMSSHYKYLELTSNDRRKHSFYKLTYIKKPTEYANNFISRFFVKNVYGFENILIKDIINTYKYQDVYVKNLQTSEEWSFRQKVLNYSPSFIVSIIQQALALIPQIFGIFLTSAITAIYIKITIICAPIFILITIEAINKITQQQISRNPLYRAFPWIGVYLYSLDMTSNKIKYLVRAFLFLILLFYFVYLCSTITISAITFFNKSYSKGLDELFYGYIAFIEFGVLLFARTRSTIKWLPKTTIIFTLIFLHYIQMTVYGFYKLGFWSLFFGTFSFFSLTFLYFEVNAMSWNPTYKYTPNPERPRALYFPLFNMDWFYDLPQLWTMFYPLHGRDYFTEAQMSLVDRNYILLSQTLNRQNQQGQQQGQQEQNPLLEQEQLPEQPGQSQNNNAGSESSLVNNLQPNSQLQEVEMENLSDTLTDQRLTEVANIKEPMLQDLK